MDLSSLLAYVPEQYALLIAALIIGCKLLTVYVQPPADTSRWAPFYRVVNLVALNIGWATNRLQVGLTGVVVARADAPAAKAAIEAVGIPLQSSGSSSTSGPAGKIGAAAIALLLGAAVSLSACGSDAVIERQQAVMAMGRSYPIAAKLAVTYEHSADADPKVVADLKPAFQRAHDQILPLMDAAEHGDPLDQAAITAGQDALSALTTLLQTKDTK
ncbi:hypothetical protein ACMAUO_12865 [Gluconacetobacter sp. Hr-1-5]|uniref:hypothetical protein n=1 Tax=Gluconacetobacter sp. Hr-1-5 TaxID=3395370 RepID=UPI003B518347